MKDPATKSEWLGSLRPNDDAMFRLRDWLDCAAGVACVIAIVWFCASLSGCAEDRWLTKEEDAEMRATCEPVGGCAVVPYPQWEKIKRALGLVDA